MRLDSVRAMGPDMPKWVNSISPKNPASSLPPRKAERRTFFKDSPCTSSRAISHSMPTSAGRAGCKARPNSFAKRSPSPLLPVAG